ncbi:MAG TPA: LuxR C-terminal-related transcriptional regulator [Candidatus Limnocylindria bacterium]|jgi:DNA-binding NarL/FixJ family response regulator|nr:LuxR C-terminal-related transcriptional regulator [Candidatus Limnocylindria bacterium]
MRQAEGRSASDEGSAAPLFSARESEIVELIALGFGDKQIAARLGISQRTVRTHLERLFDDLQIRSRAAAVALWMRGRP